MSNAAFVKKPVLSMRNVRKSYGSNRVLTDVFFTVAAGEKVAVVGENGAGKSTLAKIIAGVTRRDGGDYEVGGELVDFGSPRDALRHGIAFIPQELAYVPRMRAAENIVLGRWPGRAGLTGSRQVMREAAAAISRFGIDVALDRDMADLRLADQQIVEIVKALERHPHILVLDEPTAALSDDESQKLLELLRRLSGHGVGLVYISHRLDEVMSFADRVDVLRDGHRIFSSAPEQTTRHSLVAAMVGQAIVNTEQLDAAEQLRKLTAAAATDLSTAHTAALSITDWRYTGTPALNGVTLQVARGEVVTLFGVRGSGADLIAYGLGGRLKTLTGELTLSGQALPLFRNPRDARRRRVAYVPSDRKLEGLVLSLQIAENISLTVPRAVARVGILSKRRERALAKETMKALDVRAQGPQQPVGELSGGNQQKVLVGSRIVEQPTVLVLHEPTRGVDVGARRQIHGALHELAREGLAVLAITSDVEEAVDLGDRVLVIRNGTVVAQLAGDDQTQETAVKAAGGFLHG